MAKSTKQTKQPIDVSCPTCKARAGKPCPRKSGPSKGLPQSQPHASRRDKVAA